MTTISSQASADRSYIRFFKTLTQSRLVYCRFFCICVKKQHRYYLLRNTLISPENIKKRRAL